MPTGPRTLGHDERRHTTRRWSRCAVAFSIGVLSVALLSQPAAAQGGDADAGAEDDAGVPDVDTLGSRLPAESIMTLPPATPSPQIAPIVSEPEVASAPAAPIESEERPAALIKTILGLPAFE